MHSLSPKRTDSSIDGRKETVLYQRDKRLAGKALRVLAAGFRDWTVMPESISTEDESNLVFLGLVGMIDPVRKEVPAAIEQCRAAGIRPIMITGDHIETATAIAMQLGIITDRSRAITGFMLDEISEKISSRMSSIMEFTQE